MYLQIFIFLWWWYLIVAVCSAISLIQWLFSTINKAEHRNFIIRYLRVTDAIGDTDNERAEVDKFVRQILRSDGVFVVRMISKNAGDLVTTDIVHELWVKYLQKARNASTAAQPSLMKGSPAKSSGSSGVGDDDNIYQPDSVMEKTPLKPE